MTISRESEHMDVRTFSLAAAVTIALVAACNGPSEPTVNCSKSGTHSYFVATFNGDTIGSLPAPSTPLQYGPPGASLNVQSAPNTVQIVDSVALGSRALSISRPPVLPGNTADAVLGNINDEPNDSGIYFINFEAHGEVVPQDFIAGAEITASSAEGRRALSLRLFDGSYHLLTGGTAGALPAASRLNGTYDPGAAHSVHIELNLDTRKYSMCVNDEVVVSNRAFLDDDVVNLHSLRFFAPATITEGAQTVLVVDEIRVLK